MNKSVKFQTVRNFLFLSLILHFGLFALLRSLEMQTSRNTRPIEVSFIEKNSPSSEQFVTDPEIGKKLDQLQKKVKLLSKLSRQVKEETVAKNTGQTINRIPQQPKFNPINIPINKLKPKQSITKKDGNLPLQRMAQEDLRKSITQNLIMPSSIAEHIPGIKKANFTALNTNQFRYYAFFKRINEQIRLRWANNIRRLTYELPTRRYNQLSTRTWKSQHELVLDKNGDFVQSFTDKSSGALEIDRTVADAFLSAAPFKNPPKELIDGDGFIRLQYSFFVEPSQRRFAKDKSPGK